MKVCTKCGVEKPDTEFYFVNRTGRLQAACKSCHAIAGKKWKEANKERVAELERERQRRNPEKYRAAWERWNERNPGKAKEKAAIWHKANRDRALASGRAANRRLKDAAYAAYGGYVCSCCGETTEAFLSLDHVNNDGAQHRREVDRRKIYKWLQRNDYPEGFQVLCMNCNFGKARNGGVCPHKTLEASTTMAKASTSQAIGDGSARLPGRFVCY